MSGRGLAAYGESRKPIATYSFGGAFGIEILDEIEIPRRGGSGLCVVWRWSNERNHPRVSRVRGMADGGPGFRANRQWIRLSECKRADR